MHLHYVIMQRTCAHSTTYTNYIMCMLFFRVAAALVHCGAGVSRSACLVMMYLMRSKRWSAQQAREHCIAARSLVCPNDGFWQVLCALEGPLGILNRCAWLRCLWPQSVKFLTCKQRLIAVDAFHVQIATTNLLVYVKAEVKLACLCVLMWVTVSMSTS